jgi:hypothetical protein
MSGASALAAAKRRRAVATDPVRPPSRPNQPQNQNQNQNQPQLQQPQQQAQPQSAVQNPLNILLRHEQKLVELEESLEGLQIESKKPDTLSPDTLHFFKTQHDLLSQEIQDLKKIIIKVQTFSMETNMELIRLKKSMKGEAEPEPQNI